LHLIQDILDYTKSSFSELRLVIENTNIRDLIKKIIVLLDIKAKSRKLDLYSDVAEDVPNIIRTEPTRLKQILLNLVGNALKFTFKGHIAINVRVIREGD